MRNETKKIHTSAQCSKLQCHLDRCGDLELHPGWVWGSGIASWVGVGIWNCILGGCGDLELHPGWVWGSGIATWVGVGIWNCNLGRCGDLELQPG